MTPSERKKIQAVLMAAFPSAPFVDELWERVIGDLDYTLVGAAIDRHVATNKWPPTPAEIREAALALVIGETRAGGSAWGDAVKAIKRYGYMRTPGVDFTFDDPLVAETVSAMGWLDLCSSENQVADRARFTELYDHLAATRRRSQLSEGLPAVKELRVAQARQSLSTGNAMSFAEVSANLIKRISGPGGEL